MNSTSSLRIVSYNCRNVKSSIPDITRLCDNFDIILLQEHWLQQCELDMLNNINGLFYGRGFSAMKADEMFVGRPFGGLGVLWRKSLCWDSVVVDSIDKSVMICKFTANLITFNVINVHCPRAADLIDNTVDYLDTLGLIANCLSSLSGDVIIMGDFNASRQNKFIDYVLTFCEDEMLCLYDMQTLDECTYTFEHVGRGLKSWIDHIAVSVKMLKYKMECGVLYDYILSDHFPLFVNMQLEDLNVCVVQACKPASTVKPRLDWGAVDGKLKMNIVDVLHNSLSLVCVPTHLLDDGDSVNTGVDYRSNIDVFYKGIVECCRDVCRQCVPTRTRRTGSCDVKGRVIPGWNEQMAKLHRNARLCYKAWRDAGSPRDGAVYDKMCWARKLCKAKLRQLRRNNAICEADNLAAKVADKDVQGFWTDMSKYNKKIVSEQIEGVRGRVAIANLWADKYKALYSRHSVKESVGDICKESSFCITDKMIVNGIGQLKCKQDVGEEGIPVELLKLLPFDHLGVRRISELFNLFIKFGYVPADMVKGTLLPIVKDNKGDLGSSDNYRCIAIAGTMSKLFELIVLHYMSGVVNISDAQFGFRKGCSTDLCCDIFKRAVSSFCNEGSYVFACFVDLRKAFDMVNYWKLFDMLLELGVDKGVVRVLSSMYTNQRMCVRWDGHSSSDFPCLNGVRQGSPLSPFLFSVYIDYVLRGIVTLDAGCRLGGHLLNCLAYADDIVLFAPS